jgi:mono/diheme cytochrome c family protein
MKRLAVLALTLATEAAVAGDMQPIPPAQADYLLNCAGCHGFDGVSNSTLVPDLKDHVGYYFNLPEGRAYLVRLPNVAFSTLDDRALADMLNYAIFTLGGHSVPKATKPFGAAEVGRLRKQPLNEVALFQYRQTMVETLIASYGAPTSLRLYGDDMYGDKSGFDSKASGK